MSGLSFDADKALNTIRGLDNELEPGDRVKPDRFDPLRAAEAVTDIGAEDDDAVLENALGTNPDKRAEDIKTGQSLGVPPNIVEQEREAFGKKARAREIKSKAFNTTKAMEAITDPELSKVVHDDVDSLSSIEQILSSIPRRFAVGQRNVEMSDIGNRLMFGTARHGDEDRLDFLQRQSAAEVEEDLSYLTQVPGAVAEMVPLWGAVLSRSADEVATGIAVGAGAGLAGGPLVPVTVAGGAAAGLTAGLLTGAALETAKIEAGLAFAEYRNITDANGQKVDIDTARGIALTVGAMNGALEIVTLRQISKIVPGFDKLKSMFTREGVKQLLKVPTIRAAFTRLGRNVVRTGLTEGFTEAAQELTLIAGSIHLGEEVTIGEAAHQIGEAFKVGTQAGGGIATVGGSVQTVQDVRRAKRATQRADAMTALSEAVIESKTMERLPTHMREFVTAVKEEHGTIEEVHVDAETLKTYYQMEGAEPSEAVAEAIAEAEASGTEVEITIEDLATELAPSEGFGELAQDIRFHPDEMTSREAQDFYAEMEQIAAEQTEAGVVEEEDAIFRDVRDQLEAAGRSTDEAQTSAMLISAMIKTEAEQQGVTPQELYEQFGFQVRGLEQDEAAAIQERVTTLDQEGDNIIQLADRDPTEAAQRLQPLLDEVSAIIKTGRPGDPFVDRGVQELQKIQVVLDQRDADAQAAGKQLEQLQADMDSGKITLGQAMPQVKELQEQADALLSGPDIIELTQRVRDVLKSGQNFPANDLFQAMQAATETLFHEDARGFIQFTEARDFFRITLTGKANRSTFLHESGHFYLEMMTKLIETGQASERMQQDYATIQQFLGITLGEETTKEQHEKFARTWEVYLFEGKAPSEELRSAFTAFKQWLKQIYQTLLNLNVDLNDDIRAVFDRALASDQAILQAKENQAYVPAFEEMDEENFDSEEQFNEYVESYKKSVSASRDDLERKALSEITREKRKEIKKVRGEVEETVAAEVEARDVYRARHFLSTGEMLDGAEVPEEIRGHKISTAAVRLLTKEPLGNLTRKNGLPPDDIAPYFGFASGQELVEALADAKPMAVTIKEETDRRVNAIYGDILNDGSLGPEAADSLHSDPVAKFLLTELKIMNKRAGVAPLKTPAKILRETARGQIAGIQIIKARPEKYRQAEAKASREASQAVADKDFAAAAKAKQRQMLNHHLYREAMKVRTEETKIRNFLLKFSQKNKRIQLGKAGEEQYLNAIDQLLEGTDFRRKSMKAIEKMEGLGAWITKMEAAGEPIAVSDKLRNEADLQDYRTMTISELRELRDAVKNIDHLARFKTKLMRKNEARQLQSVIDQVRDTADVAMKDQKPSKMRNEEGFAKWMRRARWANATLTKPEFITKWLDGEVAGTLHQYLFQPFVDAQNAAYDLRKQMHEKIFKPLDQLPSAQKARWNQKVNFLGQMMRGRDVIAVALNMGNQGNVDRVVNGEAEFGWTEEKVRAELNEWMTKEDWDVVQSIWNEINVLYQPLSDVKQKLTGVRPPKVEATPFETPHGWYDGGYYPAVYDPDRSHVSHAQRQAKTAIFENNYFRPEATASASEARQGVGGRPLLFRLDVIGQHLYETIHFITHAEAVYNADKIIQHPDFQALVTEKFGPDMQRTLRPWLQTVANDAITLQEQSMIDGIMKHVRDGVSIVAMGLNLGTSMMQLFGTFTTIDTIGPKYWLIGLGKSYSPVFHDWKRVRENWNFANEKSGEMRHLTSVFDRDIRNMENQAFGKTGLKGRTARARQTAFLPIAYAQKIVNQSTWHGAYEKALDEGKSEQHAINYADAVVRQAQAGGGTKDMSVVQRGGPTQQIFYMFGTFFNVLYNRFQDVVRVSGISKKSVPEVAARLTVMAVIPVMLEEWMRGNEPDDDEEWYEWAAKRIALYGVITIPILRDIASGVLDDYGYNVSPVGSAFKQMVQAAGGLEKYLEENELTDAQWKALVKSFGVITKLPVSALWKGAKYLERAGQDELNNPVRELIFGPDREEK